MAAIYIHIPFCKKACHYCDFHFSTVFKKKEQMLAAICQEIIQRKQEFEHTKVETIYFGGGTPSVLLCSEIQNILETIFKHYDIVENPEITLEANPDDLDQDYILALSKTPVNRLSIGIQSFDDKVLKEMNRSHNVEQAKNAIRWASAAFDNISVDLIYGIPKVSNEQWRSDIQYLLEQNIPHISCYALTVEPKTALKKLIDTGKIQQPKEDSALEQFEILCEVLKLNNFTHYEMSNFGKEGYFSKNNTAYWIGKKYIGIGPSAHSYDGKKRSWNIANNAIYIKNITENIPVSEFEILTKNDIYNELVMTGLRTIWGIDLEQIRKIDEDFLAYLLKFAKKHLDLGHLEIENNHLKITQKGKFLSDGIASHLFRVDE